MNCILDDETKDKDHKLEKHKHRFTFVFLTRFYGQVKTFQQYI